MKTITIDEAIEKGYTHYATFDGDGISRKLAEVSPEHLEDIRSGEYYVAEVDAISFQIADDLIQSLVTEHLECQDEVYDEDGALMDAISDVSFKAITDAVNEALDKGARFLQSTGLRLVTP